MNVYVSVFDQDPRTAANTRVPFAQVDEIDFDHSLSKDGVTYNIRRAGIRRGDKTW